MTYQSFEPMKDPKDYMELEDIIRLYNNIENERDRTLIYTIFFSARRVSEVLALKCEDILWEEKSIHWNILKKKSPTKVLLPEHRKLILALYNYLNRENIMYRKDTYVFYSNMKGYGHPMSRQRVDQILREYGKKFRISTKGGKLPHAHCLRHSFAIWMSSIISSPEGVAKLKEKLQHSNTNLTMYYAKRFAGEMRKFWDDTELPF